MANSETLLNVSGIKYNANTQYYIPFHGVNTSTALGYLRNCIGYDPQYTNDYGIAIPIHIPKNYVTQSMTFTIGLEAYSSEHSSAPQNSWYMWISNESYETTSSSKMFSKVSANDPHKKFSIPYYSGNSDKKRTITVTVDDFNWVDGTTYYIYIWNGYTPKKFCMWRVTSCKAECTWVPKEYAISYNSNGGRGNQASDVKKHDESFYLPGCNFSPPPTTLVTYTVNYVPNFTYPPMVSHMVGNFTYYLFKQWRLNSAAGTVFHTGSEYLTNNPATFFAEWQSNVNESSIKLPSIVRAGYTFGGWYTDPAFVSRCYNAGDSFTPKGNATFYAKWIIKQYILTYDHNDGTNTKQTQTLDYNTSTTMKFTIPVRRGYQFLGWSTSAGATTPSYKTGNNIAIKDDTTIYAVWKPLEFTITYMVNGGNIKSAASYTTSIKYDTVCRILRSSDITKSKHDFWYWTTNSDGSNDSYNWTDWAGTWNKIAGEGGIDGNNKLTLYAVWRKSPYMITYQVYDKQYTYPTPIADNDKLLGIEDVLKKLNISLYAYDKFDCWSTSSMNQISEKDLWTNIDLYALNSTSPRPYTVYAKISPKCTVQYCDENNSWKKLIPIFYNQTTDEFSVLKPKINN